jgi:hypothetical protein
MRVVKKKLDACRREKAAGVLNIFALPDLGVSRPKKHNCN